MRQMPQLRWIPLAGAVLLVVTAIPARAQADPDDVNRGVARISLIEGDVSVQRGDSEDWVAGVLNAPLMGGDHIATGPNSRAEIQFDAANVMRIGGDAEVRLPELDYSRYQIELARGTLTYRVLRASNIDVEVDTPSISVRPQKQGSYRINVNDAGETELTVRAGSVEVYGPDGSQRVNAGQTMLARGSASDPEYQIVAASPRDDWDAWNDSRDRVELTTNSYQYVPPGVYGVEDLDRYGNWSYVPDYGYCWYPTVAAGWSPYSLGRWVWADWYGWTWVSNDPWGWAPYHYGRWFYSDRWYWYPGVLHQRHYWSPALVAFFGWGGGGVGFGIGNVGWVPLAPYEVFHPWWGRGYYGRGGYFNQRINITNVNVTNIYRNSRVHNGISAVRGADFERGRFHDVMHYSGNQVGEARLVRGAVPIAPGNANLHFSDRQSRVAPRSGGNTKFFTREQPRKVERIPFSQQQRAFERAGIVNRAGGPGFGPSARQGSPAQGGFRQGSEEAQSRRQPSAQDSQARGWGRFNDRPNRGGPTEGQSAAAQRDSRKEQRPAADGAPAEQQNRSGWSRFGVPGSGVQPAPRNTERQLAPQQSDRSGWNRFGSPGVNRSNPRPQSAPPTDQYRGNGGSRYEAAPRYSAPEQQRNNWPQQRYSAPPAQRYNSGPDQRYSAPAPRYNAPQSQRYNAPAPRYSAPSAPRSSGPSFGAPQRSGGFSAPRFGGGGAPRSGGGDRGGGNRRSR